MLDLKYTMCYSKRMSRAFKTKPFRRWADKAGVSDEVLLNAVREMEAGIITADLGESVYKQRIPLPGRGKRGGARTIIAARLGSRYFFLRGYAKNERENISPPELLLYRMTGAVYLSFSDEQLAAAMEKNELTEVKP